MAKASNRKATIRAFVSGGDHRTANCPKQTGGNASAAEPHSAPFVCFTEDTSENDHGNLADDEQGICAAAPPTTCEVVSQGKAVLDGGATRTIGSVHALERLMELHYQKKMAPQDCRN